MRYLLDTHVFLWLRLDPERVGRSARAQLASESAEILLSAASGYELGFKQALGELSLPGPARVWLPLAMSEMRCEPLSIELEHVNEAALLPLHHRDPFDRLMVAQARAEGLTLVTADKVLARYEVEILRP